MEMEPCKLYWVYVMNKKVKVCSLENKYFKSELFHLKNWSWLSDYVDQVLFHKS